jgi:predicted kinase
MKQGILVIISGPALTGKSTFLGGLKKAIKDFVIISTDEIRMELYHSYAFDPQKEPAVWDLTYQRIEAHLRAGDIVCLDATLRTAMHRGQVLERFPHFPVVYFAFEKPSLEVLLERNKKRYWKQFDESAIRFMHEEYQFPTTAEQSYYYKVFTITQENVTEMVVIGSEFLKGLHGS